MRLIDGIFRISDSVIHAKRIFNTAHLKVIAFSSKNINIYIVSCPKHDSKRHTKKLKISLLISELVVGDNVSREHGR